MTVIMRGSTIMGMVNEHKSENCCDENERERE